MEQDSPIDLRSVEKHVPRRKFSAQETFETNSRPKLGLIIQTFGISSPTCEHLPCMATVMGLEDTDKSRHTFGVLLGEQW